MVFFIFHAVPTSRGGQLGNAHGLINIDTKAFVCFPLKQAYRKIFWLLFANPAYLSLLASWYGHF
jgi:hypothetical protein